MFTDTEKRMYLRITDGKAEEIPPETLSKMKESCNGRNEVRSQV